MEHQQPDKKAQLTRRQFVRDGAAAAAGLAVGINAAGAADGTTDVTKARSYNPQMKYRLLGKTGLWISQVCLGGHWKRVNVMAPSAFQGGDWLGANLKDEGFVKNRHDVVSRCIERGINYIDACTKQEVLTYAEALRGRRDKMHLGFSWYQEELRNPDFRTTDKLLGTLDKGMREAKLDYVDLWRITMHEQSGRHSEGEVAEMMGALDKARKQGKARLTGFSSHDRPHIKKLIETYPEIVQVVVTPYTAKSKLVEDETGLWATMKKYGVGWFGIKPFSGTNLFKGDSAPSSPTADQDDKLAQLAIRYILCNGAITAPIPGLINQHQVDNVADAAIQGPLDKEEAKALGEAMDHAWANLGADYQWLKNWEYV
ncbi:MAG: aldo/keto reductase [Sedimentisphaerales bacterium]|nr:aldo/keto reductase [Sedimentisphaerales bacterium]